MKFLRKISLILILPVFLLSFGFPRYPALSPDGKWVAFSYQGDIWKVRVEGGEAIRLTVSKADEIMPVWSPDGKWIAFSSNRYGSYDVFVIPAEGGLPVRLTYRDSRDYVNDWTADGRAVVFTSNRDFTYHYFNYNIFKVPFPGGTPTSLVPELSTNAKISPDGRKVVFNYGSDREWRKGYRGPANLDIYIYDLEKKKFIRITRFRGNDKWPLWSSDGSKIYFVSERDGVNNLWQYDLKTGKFTQLTHFREDEVRHPSAARKVDLLAFEYKDGIYILKPGEKPRRLRFKAAADFPETEYIVKTYTSQAEDYAPSPDGKQVALVVRGEIFVVSTEGGKAKNLTRSPSREGEVVWSSDGKRLYFVSDESGNKDIYYFTSADENETRLTAALKIKKVKVISGPEDEHSPVLSPDGRKLAFVRGKGDLWISDPDGKNQRLLSPGWNISGITFSPDSKWIAFSREDNEFNSEVFIIPADGGKPVNITQHPYNDGGPVWSPDGLFLAFISSRIARNNDVWFVYLQRKFESYTKQDWKDFYEERKKEKEKKKPQVKIDFRNIHERLRRLTSFAEPERALAVSSDGKKIYFITNTAKGADIFEADRVEKKFKQLTKDGSAAGKLLIVDDGKKLFFMKRGGRVAYIDLKSGKVRSVSFRAKVKISRIAENRQKFQEGWRALYYYFYDPNFHGADWKGLRKKFLPWAEKAATPYEFAYIFNLMQGYLNASHLGCYPPPPQQRESTGMLGVLIDESYRGEGIKIKEVLPDSPADMPDSKLYPGDIILEVDGQPVGPHKNFYAAFADKVGEKVLLKVKRKGKILEVPIRTISSARQRQLLYNYWVEKKRREVERLSGGRLAYIHIQAMGIQNFHRFVSHLYAVAHGKEGLVIDVRNNPGGWITDYLLAVLMVRNHAITVPRDGGPGYPQERRPVYAWTKPIVVLANERSYSNAEIFSWAIRTLKRGKIVGEQTFGAVISTGGISLVDGTWVRLPFRGWYVNDEKRTNMEKQGCPPHIHVPYRLGEEAAGIDRQLEKAVQVLLEELKSKK